MVRVSPNSEPAVPGFGPVLSPNSKTAEPRFGTVLSPNSEPAMVPSTEKGTCLSPNSKPAQPGLGPVLSPNLQTKVRPCPFSEVETSQTRVWPGPFFEIRTCQSSKLGESYWPFSELLACQIRVIPGPFSELWTCWTRVNSELRTENLNSGQKHNLLPSCIKDFIWLAETSFHWLLVCLFVWFDSLRPINNLSVI